MRYRNEAGLAVSVIKDAETIAPRYLTTLELDAAQLRPDLELTWVQENWWGGIGGIGHYDHPQKLADADKIDATIEGKLQLAREVTSTSVDSAPTGPYYRFTGFARYSTDELWAGIGEDPYLWDETNDQWDKGTDVGGGGNVMADNGTVYKGVTYMPRHANYSGNDKQMMGGEDYWYKSSAGDNWVVSLLAPNDPYCFAVADGKLWGGGWAGNTNQIRSSTDGTNAGAWNAAVPVGGSEASITALVGVGAILYICKTDGLYSYDGTTVVTLMPLPFHAANGINATEWNKKIWIPIGGGGLRVYDIASDTYATVNPKDYIPHHTKYHGRVCAVEAGPNRLYVLIYDSTNSKYYVMAIEEAYIEGALDYRWHHLGTISHSTYTDEWAAILYYDSSMPASGSYHRRLWIGLISGANNGGSAGTCYYITEPDDLADVFTDDSDVEAITTIWQGKFNNVDKLLQNITCATGNLGSGANDHYIEVQYRVDGGSWTWITGVQATSKLTSSLQTLAFPDGINGKLIELKFLLHRGTTTTTSPELDSFTLRAQLRTSSIKLLPVSWEVADGIELLNGLEENDSSALLTQLRTWEAQVDEVTVDIGEASTYTCIFLPGNYQETVIYDEYLHRKGRRVDAVLAEV
jgi:hypothetical protein